MEHGGDFDASVLGVHGVASGSAETGGVRVGCTFADFDGERTFYIDVDARVSLVQCTFAGNTLFADDSDAAVIEAYASENSPQVRLEGCTFSNNTPSTLPTLLADHREAGVDDEAVFYSDSPSPALCTYTGDHASPTPPCVDNIPLSLEEADANFLTTTNAWFMEVQQVRPCLA